MQVINATKFPLYLPRYMGTRMAWVNNENKNAAQLVFSPNATLVFGKIGSHCLGHRLAKPITYKRGELEVVYHGLRTLEFISDNNPLQVHCFRDKIVYYAPALSAPVFMSIYENVPLHTRRALTWALLMSQSARRTRTGNAFRNSVSEAKRRVSFM